MVVGCSRIWNDSMNSWRLIILHTAVIGILAGCAGLPIMLETVGGQKEVARGEKATFYWRFQNAEYVKVSGDTNKYQAQDQVTVAPTESTNYTITAFTNNGNDSLSTVWNVRVYDSETPKNIQRGIEPETQSTFFLPTPSLSTQKTSYLSGYRIVAGELQPASLKITRIGYPHEKAPVFSVDVVPLDENGNYLSGLTFDDKHVWSIKTICAGKEEEYRPEVKEIKWNKSNEVLKMALCIERSATSSEYDETVRKAVGAFPFMMTSVDKLSVVTYNQEYNIIAPFTTKDQLNYLGEKFGNTQSKGLNSMYKIGYTTLQQFTRQNNTRNVMVIVASSSDNSSLIYTAEDIIKKATETNTKVYTIALGESVENYPLKYISAQTGGRFYYLPQEHLSEVTDVLREISYSVHGYYSLQFSATSGMLRQCKNMQWKVSYETPSGKTEEKISLPNSDENTYPTYQALSMFSFRQTIVTEEYKPLLQSIAQVLKDNPDKVIELVGHSSAEGDDDEMRKLALERTQSVRRALFEMGVNSSQIRARALGDLKPLYYFQQAEWQKDYNRRVELRWLDASVQPFEIIAEYVYAETEAIKYTEQWEKRGYKAYYERIYMNSNSGYRVKLWGYATEETANSEAKTIEKKYATKVSVE